MWLDILTKPKQGQQFRLMRAIIMNCPIDYEETNYQDTNKNEIQMMIPKNISMISSQECFGDNTKLPLTILQLIEGLKIQLAEGSKIQMT